MRPVLFTLGSFQISSYPVLICAGACLAIWLTLREVERLGLQRGLYLKICLIAFIGGILGARIMNCLVFYDLYRGKPWWKWLALWEGGLAMYGGVLLALGFVLLYVRRRGLSFWGVGDTLGPPWMLLLIAGRIGCFLNGCCYGSLTAAPWGLAFRSSAGISGFHVTRHPTQLYEAVAALAIFLVMWRLRKQPRFAGQVSLAFFLLYPVARFVIEFFRDDPRGMWRFCGLFTLSESQIISIPVLLLAGAAWGILSRKAESPLAGGSTGIQGPGDVRVRNG